MEALYTPTWEKDGVMVVEDEEEKREEQEEGGIEASSPTGSTDEETEEDSEPEAPPVVRRKVSFADAFGLNLVSVKEFDNADVTDSVVSAPPEMEAIHSSEEFYMSCLFTVPSTPEELDQRLQEQTIELESIEILPGTTTLRGIIRVVNLCYSKSVYVRFSLDGWSSQFDLLAEYVPGSSDRKTDRFAFWYSLVPPFDREGTRVEFCLRYETSVGTFWANNKDMNFVLFCRQKVKDVKAKEQGPQVQEEIASHKSKRSCLKANRRGSAEEKTTETIHIAAAAAEAAATHKAEEADRETVDSAETHSILYHEEHKPLADSIKSQRRATHLARVQDFFSQRSQRVPKAYSVDSANGLTNTQPHRIHHHHHHSQSMPAPWGSSAGFFRIRQKKRSNESPQVLTYHQIPLLTLDWSNDKSQHWGTADVDDMWTGGIKRTSSKTSEENKDNAPSVSELWEAFLNGTDENIDDKTSVCDIWQAFLNGPDCKDHSGVPESEWLQTAASVSPSNHKEEPRTQCAESEQRHTFQLGTDTPAHGPTHTSAEWQPVSHTPATLSANAALNTEEPQPAEVCVSTPRDDNAAAHDASQKSETRSVTDTLQEFGLTGVTPVSEGSVDSSTQWHKHAVWERERGGKIVRTGEGGGDEPFTPHIADLVTSSGETGTTEMTAMPESQNASAVDRISQGARLDEGLSYSGEGEVTGTAHNATDDTLAFRETIRQGTKDGGRFVLFTSRQGMEEGFTPNCTEKKVYTEKEIFRPQETEECEISQRYADEKKCEEFRPNQNSENALKQNETDEDEIRLAQSRADEFKRNQTDKEKFRQSQITASESKLDESERDEVMSNHKDLEEFSKAEAEVEVSNCTASEEAKRQIGVEVEINQAMDEKAWQQNEKALQLNPSVRLKGDKLMISKAHDKQSRAIQAVEEIHVQKEKEEDLTLTQTEENVELKCGETGDYVLISSQTEESTRQIRGGIIPKKQEPCREINTSVQTREEVFTGKHSVESIETRKVLKSDREDDEFRPFEIDKCKPNPMEMVDLSWTQTQEDVKSQREQGVGGEMSPQLDTVKEKLTKEGISAELQHRPEILKGIEEDMSQRDKYEKVSIGKLKMEAMEELICDAENTQEESENAPAELKEHELSAEQGESSPQVECKKMSEETKDPITADDIVALELIESGVEEIFTERLGQDLDEGIWEEVLDWKDGVPAPALKRETDIVEEMGNRLAGVIHDSYLTKVETLSEEDLNEAFDSGVFSLTGLPTDPNVTASQGLSQTLATSSDTPCAIQSSQSLIKTGQSLISPKPTLNFRPLGERATESDVPLRLRQNLPLLVKDQKNFKQIKERPVSHQEIYSQLEDCVVSHKESFNQSAHPSHESLSSSSEKLDEASVLVWWSVLYFLSHVTRTLVCALLVAGFFVITLLYDFPACFALYVLSMCWWFCQWKRHRVTVTKGMVG